MQIDILFLLYLQDINKLEIYFNNLENNIIIKNIFTISIIRIYRYLFLI